MTAAEKVRIALVGIGKIARDQHIPAIEKDPRFVLTATASRSGGLAGLPSFSTVQELIAGGPKLDAVSLCTPPRGRDELAEAAIDAGLHVMLEKPPGLDADAVEALAERARKRGVTLFATWHSREAAGVARARVWLADKRITSGRVVWREDIRRWHPGQEWILEDGGFGVLDPGINALSVVTAILPAAVTLEDAELEIPEGRGAPIAAQLTLASGEARIEADLDFRESGAQSWDIEIATEQGTLTLSEGGQNLAIPGESEVSGENREYPNLYARFHSLIEASESDVDVTPLRLALEALRSVRKRTVLPFAF